MHTRRRRSATDDATAAVNDVSNVVLAGLAHELVETAAYTQGTAVALQAARLRCAVGGARRCVGAGVDGLACRAAADDTTGCVDDVSGIIPAPLILDTGTIIDDTFQRRIMLATAVLLYTICTQKLGRDVSAAPTTRFAGQLLLATDAVELFAAAARVAAAHVEDLDRARAAVPDAAGWQRAGIIAKTTWDLY